MTDIKDEYVSVCQAAKEKRCSKQAIHVAIRQKRIVATRLGKEWLIHKDDLKSYVPRLRKNKQTDD